MVRGATPARTAISSTVGWSDPASSSAISASTIAARVRADRAARPSIGRTSSVSAATRARLGRGADAVQFPRTHEGHELAAAAFGPDPRDAALLELHAGARQVMDDLRQVRVVADEENPALVPGGEQQLLRVARVESLAQRRVLDRLAAQRLARQAGGGGGPHPGARVDGLEGHPERGQSA